MLSLYGRSIQIDLLNLDSNLHILLPILNSLNLNRKNANPHLITTSARSCIPLSPSINKITLFLLNVHLDSIFLETSPTMKLSKWFSRRPPWRQRYAERSLFSRSSEQPMNVEQLSNPTEAKICNLCLLASYPCRRNVVQFFFATQRRLYLK